MKGELWLGFFEMIILVVSNSVLARVLERISNGSETCFVREKDYYTQLASKSGMCINSEYSCESFEDPLYQWSKAKNKLLGACWTSLPLGASSRKPSWNKKSSNEPRSAFRAMNLKRSAAENEKKKKNNVCQCKSLPQQEVTEHCDDILIP